MICFLRCMKLTFIINFIVFTTFKLKLKLKFGKESAFYKMGCYARTRTVSRSLLTLFCDSLKNYESDYNYDCGISYADFHCKYHYEEPYLYTDDCTLIY